MSKLVTNDGTIFDMAFGGPVSVTEGVVFLAKIINSDIDSVHNIFKDPRNTESITIFLNESLVGDEFSGYIRYCGFSLEDDGGIIVTLKRNVVM